MTSTEKVPVVADAFLDYVGEVWAAQDKKTFPTFLAYLNYQVYGREHGVRPGAPDTPQKKRPDAGRSR